MKSKLILAKLLQKYTVVFPEDYEMVEIQVVNIKPKGDVPCVLKLNE
jgi:hypothetical protein